MDNDEQIRTMKDDIEEARSKLESSTEKLAKKPEEKEPKSKAWLAPDYKKESEAEKYETEAAYKKNKSAVKEIPKDKEVSELKNLISRVSKVMEKKEVKESSIVSALETKTASKKEVVEKQNVPASIPKPIPEKAVPAPVSKNSAVKSFWKNIAEKLKFKEKYQETEKPKVEKDYQKEIARKAKEEQIKPEEITESGLLKISPEKEPEKTEKEEKLAAKSRLEESGYTLPENRLILGKQEFYSSLKKQIDVREEKNKLEELEKAAKKKQEAISEEEERKKLRNKIISKYHINLYPIHWKRIVFFAVFFLATVAAIYYFLFSSIKPLPPKPPEPAVSGNELGEFAGISSKIEIQKNKIAAPGFWEGEIEKFFSASPNKKIIKLVIKDGERMATFKEALEGIKVNAANFPENFLSSVTDNYNLFAFKSNMGTVRMGIAIQSKNASLKEIMKGWENEKNKAKKMHVVFKPIFGSDYVEDETAANKSFVQTNYGGTYIFYLHLPDENTSFNYFFLQGDILTITPSKDTAFMMIDIANRRYFE